MDRRRGASLLRRCLPLALAGALGLCAMHQSRGQQIVIPRIEQMPRLPSPYLMRDWKAVARGYDSLVFDFGRTGTYLPLVWWNTATVNYPGEKTFGLHTVVGTTDPASSEAITVIPAVVGATLSGIDKGAQNGENWARMCREFFNRSPGEQVYLNNPRSRSGSDWWYDTMPNVFFYQLAWLYPGTADFDAQFLSVAERWLQAVGALGGRTTPWGVPSMHYRAIALSTMTPLAVGVQEPEAAGAIGWLLYMAYIRTGDRRYREGAEQCMEFLNGLVANPSYELQLGYGTLLAARMNAELGTSYNTQKLVNWCFDVGPLRNWGAIVGRWGGIDCSGLIGEVNGSNDYAFFMNGCELAGTMAPLVRYDTRFARATGRWLLNLANSSRLFYPDYLPDANQDSREWSRQYDPGSTIAHEALRQQAGGASPFATGDAISGGWGRTNLALYGSSHAGILGGLIETTAVSGILRVDLCKTDYYRQAAYPTYLLYNPHSAPEQVALPASAGAVDIYDAASHTFMIRNASEQPSITVPPDAAVVAVIVPAGGMMTFQGRAMLINAVVVDYAVPSGALNRAPRLKGLGALPPSVARGGGVMLFATPEDPDADSLSVRWFAEEGTLSPAGEEALWSAPVTLGRKAVRCRVTDAHGAWEEDTLQIEVKAVAARAPHIRKFVARPGKVQPGGSTDLIMSAEDSAGLPLSFSWSATAGSVVGNDSLARWTAPAQAGDYRVYCTVANDSGGTVRDSIGLEVRDFSLYPAGSLIGWYPLDGNGQDLTLHANTGTPSDVVAVPDRSGAPAHALRFNGSTAGVRIPDQPYLNSGQAVTVSFWFSVAQFLEREQYPVSHGNWERRWKASISGLRLRWTVKTSTGVSDLDSRSLLAANRYYHAVLVYSGTEMELYLDGHLESFKPWSGTLLPAGVDLMIGQVLPGSTAYGFTGDIDDVRLFDYPLQPPAVEQLFATPSGAQEKASALIPLQPELLQNFPNPFNPATTIRFGIPRGSWVDLRVADLLGRTVAVLEARPMEAGRHACEWNASGLPSGCYFVTLSAGGVRLTQKAMLVR